MRREKKESAFLYIFFHSKSESTCARSLWRPEAGITHAGTFKKRDPVQGVEKIDLYRSSRIMSVEL